MKLIQEFDPLSQENLNYQELARLLMTPERFKPSEYTAKVLHLPETNRIYEDGVA